MIWDEILSMAMAHGLWAVLFCALLIYILRDSRKREAKYMETIKSLSSSLEIIGDIKQEILDIKKDTENLLQGAKSKKTKSISAEKKTSISSAKVSVSV